jgi:hypothetical protein
MASAGWRVGAVVGFDAVAWSAVQTLARHLAQQGAFVAGRFANAGVERLWQAVVGYLHSHQPTVVADFWARPADAGAQQRLAAALAAGRDHQPTVHAVTEALNALNGTVTTGATTTGAAAGKVVLTGSPVVGRDLTMVGGDLNIKKYHLGPFSFGTGGLIGIIAAVLVLGGAGTAVAISVTSGTGSTPHAAATTPATATTGPATGDQPPATRAVAADYQQVFRQSPIRVEGASCGSDTEVDLDGDVANQATPGATPYVRTGNIDGDRAEFSLTNCARSQQTIETNRPFSDAAGPDDTAASCEEAINTAPSGQEVPARSGQRLCFRTSLGNLALVEVGTVGPDPQTQRTVATMSVTLWLPPQRPQYTGPAAGPHYGVVFDSQPIRLVGGTCGTSTSVDLDGDITNRGAAGTAPYVKEGNLDNNAEEFGVSNCARARQMLSSDVAYSVTFDHSAVQPDACLTAILTAPENGEIAPLDGQWFCFLTGLNNVALLKIVGVHPATDTSTATFDAQVTLWAPQS